MAFDIITLPNGLRVIGEKIPYFRSVSVGLWVGAGSQYETAEQNGVSHFIEHMLFKGTKRYTARELAEVIDAVGGQINAFTGKDCTCFYAKVVDEHLRLALDVLTDMVLHSNLDPEDIEREKGVVLEEIAMAEDSPEDVVGELIMEAQFGDQPLSRNILGTEDTVDSFTREDVVSYMNAMYRPENCVLAVAGNYDLTLLKNLADEFLGDWKGGLFVPPAYHTAVARPTILRREKDIEQVQICLGYKGYAGDVDETYPQSLFSNVYGGASSSRLFQTIREEKGLAYSVYSSVSSFTDAGQFVIYAGVNRDNVDAVMELIEQEKQNVLRNGLTHKEFEQGREQIKGGIILGLESTSNRMSAIGRRMLLLNNTVTENEVLDKLNSMTYDDVMDVARDILQSEEAVAIVGRDVEAISVHG